MDGVCKCSCSYVPLLPGLSIDQMQTCKKFTHFASMQWYCTGPNAVSAHVLMCPPGFMRLFRNLSSKTKSTKHWCTFGTFLHFMACLAFFDIFSSCPWTQELLQILDSSLGEPGMAQPLIQPASLSKGAWLTLMVTCPRATNWKPLMSKLVSI